MNQDFSRLGERMSKLLEADMSKVGSGTHYSSRIGEVPAGYPNFPDLKLLDSDRPNVLEAKLGGLRRPPLTEREVLSRDVENAKRQFDRILDMAGVPKSSDAGVTKKQLDALAASSISGPDRDAVNFLRKNFATLNTSMQDSLLGEWWCPSDDSRITLKSLMAYKDGAISTGRRKADGPQPPTIVDNTPSYPEQVIKTLKEVSINLPHVKLSAQLIDLLM